MANLLAPVARQRIQTDLGVVAPGALLYTLVSGSPSTPLTTTSDAAGLIANANPIVASAGGLFGPIYLAPGVAYHFRLTDAAGVPIWDQDPVTAGVSGGPLVVDNLTVNGILTVTGYGTHSIIAGGPGILSFVVQNTQAGPAALAQVAVGNDVSQNLLGLFSFSSTYVPTVDTVPNGSTIRQQGAGGLTLNCTTAAPLRFLTNFLERMRITPAGGLLINAVANPVNALVLAAGDAAVTSAGLAIQSLNVANNFSYCVFFNSAFAAAGTIVQTGATTVSYLTTSDRRLKTDHGPATDVDALRAVVVHDFTWTADGGPDRGVFAQEAHALYPRAVSPGTDAMTENGSLARPWMTDYSKFVPDLIVGWQQHDAAIAELRAAVAQLTGSP